MYNIMDKLEKMIVAFMNAEPETYWQLPTCTRAKDDSWQLTFLALRINIFRCDPINLEDPSSLSIPSSSAFPLA